jgi:hypothetical protein
MMLRCLNAFEETQIESRYIHHYMSTYLADLYHSTADSDTATLQHLVQEFRTMGNLGSESNIPEGWKRDSVTLFTTLLTEEDNAAVTELPTQEM